jgi:hypothetical protein
MLRDQRPVSTWTDPCRAVLLRASACGLAGIWSRVLSSSVQESKFRNRAGQLPAEVRHLVQVQSTVGSLDPCECARKVSCGEPALGSTQSASPPELLTLELPQAKRLCVKPFLPKARRTLEASQPSYQTPWSGRHCFTHHGSRTNPPGLIEI